MATMPAARIHAPNEIRIDRVPCPEVGPDQVLVQVKQCGICGSDLTYSKLGGIPGAASPFAFGHEFAGTVARTGEQVTHVAEGDRVVVNPGAGDNGIGSAGLKGAFAPYVLVENVVQHPESVIRLPDELDFETGALIEPLAVGTHAVNQGSVAPGDRVVVFGGGPVGLASALVAQYRGAKDVIVVDLSARRLEVARELGLTPCPVSGGEVEAYLKDVHGTVVLDRLLGEQAATDVYIEATGSGPVFEQILNLARKGGRVVLVGVHFAPVSLNMINLLMRELTIVGSEAYHGEFPDVVDMLMSSEVDVSPLISHRFALSDFDNAFAQAQRQDEAVKVLVDCQR